VEVWRYQRLTDLIHNPNLEGDLLPGCFHDMCLSMVVLSSAFYMTRATATYSHLRVTNYDSEPELLTIPPYVSFYCISCDVCPFTFQDSTYYLC